MVFPSTQVEFHAARLPWLSAGLALVSFWVLLAVPAALSTPERDPKAALESAVDYWQTHGYLDPDDRITESARARFDFQTQPLAIAAIREIPLRAARWLANLAVRSKKMAILYLIGLFYVLPALLVAATTGL